MNQEYKNDGRKGRNKLKTIVLAGTLVAGALTLGFVAKPVSTIVSDAFSRLSELSYVDPENSGPDSEVYQMNEFESGYPPTTRDFGGQNVLTPDGRDLSLTPEAKALSAIRDFLPRENCRLPYSDGDAPCDFYSPEP